MGKTTDLIESVQSNDVNKTTGLFSKAWEQWNLNEGCSIQPYGRGFRSRGLIPKQNRFGHGKHLIFLHKANDIGGGKSDESLTEGRLAGQVATLSREFDWWINGLE